MKGEHGLMSSKPTQIPLVMPKKYVQWTIINGVEDSPMKIESYRAYYQAKITKKYMTAVICRNCNGNSDDYYGEGYPCDQCKFGKQYPKQYDLKYTNRIRPDWLEI